MALCLRGEQEPERTAPLSLRLVRNPQVPVPDCSAYDRLLEEAN